MIKSLLLFRKKLLEKYRVGCLATQNFLAFDPKAFA